MKRIVTLIALVGLSAGPVSATLDPGAVVIGSQSGGYTVTLFDDSLNQVPPETFTYNLPFTAQLGDLVLVEHNITGNAAIDGQNSANWSDVVRFGRLSPANTWVQDQQAILYSWDDWSSFGSLLGNVKYIYENNTGQENGPGEFTVYAPQANIPVTYNIESVVPEPTTMIAGALLLLPFGASTLRMLRKNRTA
jgi:hypothetical protein